MLRRIGIATISATLLVAACKVSDKQASPGPVTRSDPAASPTGTAAKPGDPPARSASASPGKSAAAALPLDPELEAKGLAMMQRLADVAVADGKDCEKLATDIKAFAAENKLLLAQLVAVEQQESAGQRAAFSQRNAAVQAAVAQKMQAAMTACAANPSVLAALQDFPGE